MIRIPINEAIERTRTYAEPVGARVREKLEDWRDGFADYDDDGSRFVGVVPGNVNAADQYLVSAVPILIEGDLTVPGELTDLIETDQSLLVVTGNVRCGWVWTLGCIFIAGSLDADVVYGASSHSHWTDIGGDLRARVVIENGHSFTIAGSLHAASVCGDRIWVRGERAGSSGEPLGVLVGDVLDAHGTIDEERLYQWLQARKDVRAAPE